MNEQQKVQAIYRLIGDRGLYVSTNLDIFTEEPERIDLASGAGFQIELAQPNSQAYASPLLFATLTSLMKHGTMLLTGGPGIGKTTCAEYSGHFFTGTDLDEIIAAEIQGHPQHKEEDMTGSYDLAKLMAGSKVVIPSAFLQSPVKIIDEVNRNPPDILSILMKLADTGKAVYGGTLLKGVRGPLFATANYADEGTFELTPPFLDRFDVAVMVTSPPAHDLAAIRGRGDEKLNGNGLQDKLRIDPELQLDFEKIRGEIYHLPEASSEAVGIGETSAFADFVYASLRFCECASSSLPRATKGNAWKANQERAAPGHFTDTPELYTLNELTIRTVKAMMRYARAFAWFTGKSEVELSDLKTVLPYLLWHKVVPSQKALTENQRWANDRIGFVTDLIGKIETEYSSIKGLDEIKTYQAALMAIRNTQYPLDKVLVVTKKALQKIGNVDKPYALVMAQQIAAEYNNRVLGGN